MAEKRVNDDQDVFATLRKATDSLNKVADLLRDNGRGHAIHSEASSSSTPCSSTTVSLTAASPSPTSGIFSEHRRLFGNAAVRANSRVHQIAAAMRFSPLSSGATQTTTSTRRKRSRRTGGGGFAKRNQWTHKFCCLANVDAWKIPTVEEKITLRAAGLGEKEMTLDKCWSASRLHEKLSETFPKLHGGGGYEFLRTDGRSTSRLVLIPGSKVEGYSVQYLKDNLNQATAYIRPLQNDLSLAPLEGHEVEMMADIPMEECKQCGFFFCMTDLREHLANCNQMLKTENGKPVQIKDDLVYDVSQPQSRDDTEPVASSSSEQDSPSGLATLQDLFPEKDTSTLGEILHRCGGNVARAVDMVFNDDSSIFIEDTDRVTNTDAGFSSGAVNTEDIAIEEDMILTQLLKQQRERYLKAGIQRINIARDTLWEDSVAIFKSSRFDPSKSPRIKFEDEEGIDAGGLRREYFTLLLKALANHPALFEGKEDNKAITYNTSALQSNMFFLAGRMIACAIMHCDVGMPVFSRSMYYFISHENVDMTEVPHHAEDLPDCSVVELVRKIENVESPESLEEIKNDSELSDLLQAAGWDKLLTYDNRAAAMQLLVAHEVFYKRKLCIDQFCKGLNVVGVLHLIRGHPELMLPFFVHKVDEELSPELLFGQFCNINNLVGGTNDVMRQHLKRAISQCYGEFGSSKLEDFLMFATGLSAVPPLGLDDKITITYRPDDCPYFFAETCTMELKVPTVHTDYGMFYKSFLEACQHSTAGFHCT